MRSEPTRRRGSRRSLSGGWPETILLVEDETSVRDLTRRMLEASGYRVFSAANGGEALRLCTINREHIDLMVTDVVMPQMRGVEVARRVARIRPRLRVLFMSGYTDNSIDLEIAGSVSFLQKPFMLDDSSPPSDPRCWLAASRLPGRRPRGIPSEEQLAVG